MCKNNCEMVNLCEGTIVTPATDNFTIEKLDALKHHIEEREEFDRQLQREKAETDRFRQLYLSALGYIYATIRDNNIGMLNEAIKKFAELESEYAKK